ncbi:hypothetical protein ACHAW6_015497 [Cyclotella cf. meneghiniana]
MSCFLNPTGGMLITPGSSADQDILIGVVSWGIGCGNSSLSGVFTRVSEAFDWISTTVCSESIDLPEYFCNGMSETTEPAFKLTKEPTQEPTSEPMNALISEGTETEASRYQYMVALVDKLDDIYSLLMNAVIGHYDMDSTLGEEVLVDRVVASPNYDDTHYVNDFAFIFLSQPTSLVTELVLLNSDESLPAIGDMAGTVGWETLHNQFRARSHQTCCWRQICRS